MSVISEEKEDALSPDARVLRAAAASLAGDGVRFDSATPHRALWLLTLLLRLAIACATGWLALFGFEALLPELEAKLTLSALFAAVVLLLLQRTAIAAADRRSANFMDAFAERLLDWAEEAPRHGERALHSYQLRDFLAFGPKAELQLMPVALEGATEGLVIRGTLGRRLLLPWRLAECRVFADAGVQVAVVELAGVRPFRFLCPWRTEFTEAAARSSVRVSVVAPAEASAA